VRRRIRQPAIVLAAISQLAVTVALVSMMACGPTGHLVTTAELSAAFARGAVTAQEIIETAHTADAAAVPNFEAWEAGFGKIGAGIKVLNQGIRDADQQVVVKQVAVLTGVLKDLVTLEIPKLKESQRALVTMALASVQATLTVIGNAWAPSGGVQ
jgi:hypothetical protein